MSDRQFLSERRTLYDALAEPASPGSIRGETALTAAKETMDNDQEDELTSFLLDQR